MSCIDQKNTMRVYLLSGELIEFPVDPTALLDYEAMSEQESTYFIGELIEAKSVSMGIRPPLRSHRLNLSKPSDDHFNFDYIAVMDPFDLDCISYNNTNNEEKKDESEISEMHIKISKVAHILDAGDWLDLEETVNIDHLILENNISIISSFAMMSLLSTMSLFDNLCRIIADKRPPTTLTWDISANDYDHCIKNFQSVRHLNIKSHMSEDFIHIIRDHLKNVTELTMQFNFSVSVWTWNSLLASTNIKNIHIEYSPSFVSNQKRVDYYLGYQKFEARIDEWPEWEVADKTCHKNVQTIHLQRYEISKYGVVLDQNYL
jgi:hypothetical protein